jgi:ribonuclease HII
MLGSVNTIMNNFSLIDTKSLGKHCGVDEVGRGALSGPVVAAAVRLNKSAKIYGLNDSKKLSPAIRQKLYYEIIENAAVGVSFKSSAVIDSENILQSSLLAMEESVSKILESDDKVYFDGNILPKSFRNSPLAFSVIEGDRKIANIAAASIVAKVSRDFFMNTLNILHPGYGWAKNVGYGVPSHIEGIYKLGINTHHRRSFKPIYNIL